MSPKPQLVYFDRKPKWSPCDSNWAKQRCLKWESGAEFDLLSLDPYLDVPGTAMFCPKISSTPWLTQKASRFSALHFAMSTEEIELQFSMKEKIMEEGPYFLQNASFFFAQIPSKWKLSLDPSSLCAPVPCWVLSHLLGALLGSLPPTCHICHICLSLPSWLSSALLSISSWGSSFHRLVFTVGRATYSVIFTYIFKNKNIF